MANYLLIYLLCCIIYLALAGLVVISVKIKHPFRVILVLLFLMLIPLAVIYFAVIYGATIPETKTPYLVGLAAEEAAKISQQMNLSTVVIDKTYEPGIPENQVVYQKPEPGRSVKQGRSINLVVSMGQKSVTVPNLIGKDSQQIEVVLTAVGLCIGTVDNVNSTEFADGTVISQSPVAGEEVASGSSIEVVIAVNANDRPSGQNSENEETQP
ncbi:MAG: PASTA domain-containing protein [Candidatus Margulisiibacteriota bacterium]